MAIPNLQIGQYKNLTASANVKSTDGALIGVFCATSSSGTLSLYDSASTTTTTPIVATFNLTAATYYPIPVGYDLGLYAVIGGTANVTLIYV